MSEQERIASMFGPDDKVYAGYYPQQEEPKRQPISSEDMEHPLKGYDLSIYGDDYNDVVIS